MTPADKFELDQGRVMEKAEVYRARQVAMTLALSFGTFVMFIQFVRFFLG
jgi:hypothetical protein